MPYSDALLELPESVRKLSTDKQIRALLRSRFFAEAHPMVSSVGEGGDYPQALLLAVTLVERVFASQEAARTELSEPHRWSLLISEFREVTGDHSIRLPSGPPTARVMDRFLKALVDPASDFLERLHEAQLVAGVSVAEICGNFPTDPSQIPTNLCEFDLRFVVHGDGTYIAPYSDVRKVTCSETGEVSLEGSRATDPNRARIQTVKTDGAEDGKADKRGINHVAISTYTNFGEVVLHTGQALGGEGPVALKLLKDVHEKLQDRLVWLVWDRVITGHLIEDSFQQCGAIVVNKDVKDGSPGRAARLTDKEARRRHRDGIPLPIGTSVFATTNGSEVIPTRNEAIGDHIDQGCRHMLWRDAGAIFVVKDAEQLRQEIRIAAAEEPAALLSRLDVTPVKIQPVLASQATRSRINGAWSLHTVWTYPCPDDPGTTHQLSHTEYARADELRSDDIFHPQLKDVRTIPRIDPRFAAIHGRRNVTESLQTSIKRTIGTGVHKGRSLRLDPRHQDFLHLSAAVLITAKTEFRQASSATFNAAF